MISPQTVHGIYAPLIKLNDRRSRPERTKEWMFTKSCEQILYGQNDRTTGAFNVLLQRNSLQEAVMVVEKAAVDKQLVTEEERETIMESFKNLLDVSSRNRVKRCSIVPTSVVTAAAQHFGRCSATSELLRTLNTEPRHWQVADEAEENERNLQVDLVLNEELEELEEESVHIATELVQMVEYEVSQADETKAESTKLERIPPALVKELEEYVQFRCEPLNRLRTGTAVVDTTVSNDKATVLRFLGHLKTTHEIVPGLGVFAQPTTAEWVEAYLKHLQEKELRWSTLANYVNSLISVTQYVYHTFQITAEIAEMQTSPLDQMLSMRSQCEAEAKHQALYSRRDKNWIDWDKAQVARQTAEAVKHLIELVARNGAQTVLDTVRLL